MTLPSPFDSTAGLPTRAEIFYASTIATGVAAAGCPARDEVVPAFDAGRRLRVGGRPRAGETPANVATGPAPHPGGRLDHGARSGYGNPAVNERFQQVPASTSPRGGRSSKSYRAEGLWDTVLQLLNEKGAPQKNRCCSSSATTTSPASPAAAPTSPPSSAPTLTALCARGQGHGAEIISSRRSHGAASGWVARQRPAPWAEAVMRVAEAEQVPVPISTPSATPPCRPRVRPRPTPWPKPPPRFDRTHLGPKGAALLCRHGGRGPAQAAAGAAGGADLR